MKKLLLTLLGLIFALALAAPAAVGWLAEQRLREWIDEQTGWSLPEWQRGWLRSSAELAAADWQARLQFRHTPLSPPGWLEVQGLVRLQDPPMVVDLLGRIDPALNTELTAYSPVLEFQTQAVWHIGSPRLALRRERDGLLRGVLSMNSFVVADGLGNQLMPFSPEVRFELHENDGLHNLRISTQADHSEGGHLELRLALLNLDPDSAAALWTQLRALAEAQAAADESGTRLARLGIATALAQLASQGVYAELQLQIEDPVPSESPFGLQAHYDGQQRLWRVQAEGSERLIADWLVPMIGLQHALTPAQAAAWLENQLAQLVSAGLLERVDGRVVLDLSAG
ncbi:MAG: hypothetical protein Kow0020_09280 [Wenzhouxiangellaceae bacterium]